MKRLNDLRQRHALWPALTLYATLSLSALLSACGGGSDATSTAASTSAAQAVVARLAAPPAPAPAAPPAPPAPPAGNLSALAQLGQQIFSDPNLSEPRGTACVACHQANKGFSDLHGSPVSGVAQGSQPGALGLRNPLANAYEAAVGAFGLRPAPNNPSALVAVGGHFWDGRADTLAIQALQPFLNAVEMNNPNAAAVVAKVAAAPYAALFKQQFGNNALADTSQAFTQIGLAIQAFEQSQALQPFTSKYDAMVRGQATLSPAEQHGMAVYMDRTRANCIGCHQMNPTSGNPADSLFSGFAYFSTGIPRNTAITQNANPSFFDLGLCGPQRQPPSLPANAPANVQISDFCGKFRTPSLRNAGLRGNFMHNGVLRDLNEVVSFYSTRVSNPKRWYGPSGVPNDLPAAYLKNLEVNIAPFNRKPTDGPVLTAQEASDLVAFLQTLTDGFTANPATTQ
jgi:cytochrome c peroxidase